MSFIIIIIIWNGKNLFKKIRETTKSVAGVGYWSQIIKCGQPKATQGKKLNPGRKKANSPRKFDFGPY